MDEATKRARGIPDAIAGEGSPSGELPKAEGPDELGPLNHSWDPQRKQWIPDIAASTPPAETAMEFATRGIVINVVEDIPQPWTFEDNPDVSAMVRPATPARVKFASDAIEINTGSGRMSAGSLYDSVVALARSCLEGEIEGITVKQDGGRPDEVADFETIATHCPHVIQAITMFARDLNAELEGAAKN